MYLPNKDQLGKYWACDIEGDNLPSNIVWCLCAVNVLTGLTVELSDPREIKEWVNTRQSEGCKFIFHNGIGYDAPTLNRLLGTRLTIVNLVDTLLLSMVYSPSLDGGHSLESWGIRLKYPKGEFNDFSRRTPEMLEYCLRDAKLCGKIFLALVQRMRKVGFSELGLELEHRSWQLIKKQQDVGFPFNYQEANILYAKLRGIEDEIKEQIHEYWPPTLQCLGTYQRAYKKDGTPSANYERHCEQYEDTRLLPDGRYEVYGYVYFNIGSPTQRIEKLLEAGWKPEEFTKPSKTHPRGQPKATDKGNLSPSLERFVEESGKIEVRLIADWITYNSRANMINTWMEAYNEKTGRIHGSLWYANTLRYRHSNPNSANIPAVRVDGDGNPLLDRQGSFTYEARDLWACSDPSLRRLVGVDAKGIQLRVLANYLNNPDFTEAVLSGDPHSYNQKIGGFERRSTAKTFIYSFLLGAGDAKVGQIIGGSTKDGRELKKLFIGNFPGLSDLLDDLARQVERTGRIVLCDGTPIIVSAPHTRLGYLLQGDETRIMRRAAINTAGLVYRRNLDVIKVGDIHDEWQNDALAAHAEEFAFDVCPSAFQEAGRFFNYKLPIDCDAKIGLTWAQTH